MDDTEKLMARSSQSTPCRQAHKHVDDRFALRRKSKQLNDRIQYVKQWRSVRITAKSKEIDHQLTQELEFKKKEVQLIVLGSSGSGKSTFVRHFRIHHGDGFPEEERLILRVEIIRNLMDALQNVIRHMQIWGLHFSDPYIQMLVCELQSACAVSTSQNESCGDAVAEAELGGSSSRHPNSSDSSSSGRGGNGSGGGGGGASEEACSSHAIVQCNSQQALLLVKGRNKFSRGCKLSNKVWRNPHAEDEEELCSLLLLSHYRKYFNHVKNIADQPEFQECLNCAEFFTPPMEYYEQYFLTHLDRLIQLDYVPTLQDILAMRKTSFSVRETAFSLGVNCIRFIDLAGQRPNRKKWMHYFEHVHAVLFFVSLKEFFSRPSSQANAEDLLNNTLNIFQELLNNPFLYKKNFLLFFTQRDLLEVHLARVNVQSLFPSYQGEDQNCHEVIDFIRQKFLDCRPNQACKGKRVFCHVVCLLDIDKMKMVFREIISRVLDTNLKKTGLL